MNLALEKRVRVTTGCKGRGEIISEVGKVTGMVADAPIIDSLGSFGGWGMAAGKVEVLLVISGLDMDRSMETYLVNMDSVSRKMICRGR